MTIDEHITLIASKLLSDSKRFGIIPDDDSLSPAEQANAISESISATMRANGVSEAHIAKVQIYVKYCIDEHFRRGFQSAMFDAVQKQL